ncbi:Cation-transporting P-type ATPase [Macleaya cordata]|uniref:Cation-transporting P-type ATPase n=1 Tax=Macleaya cordata TaxID=56857 RepID=A0A200PMA5_MACCD|nr:Cation-transporting P-type ATPase [Macleaya cordata]
MNSSKTPLISRTINSSRKFISISYSSSSSRLARFSSSAASLSSSGGGGDNESNGRETKEVPALSSDVITLDVKGMMCEGCAGSVKRMLESQPQVSSANVNLATETATVLPVPEAKVVQNWQQHLGETLAKHLTNCGFNSNLRDPVEDTAKLDIPMKC